MTDIWALTFVEIDVDYCSLTYGVSPCTASIPTTGSIKCFNTLGTCQDRENFTNEPVTLRFVEDTGFQSQSGIEALPFLLSVDIAPGAVSLGENLGERTSVTVTFKNAPHSDTGPGFDKYLADRTYDPYSQGTFWGKFRARQPYLRGRALRVIRGDLGQSIEEMETRHYVIESFDGPTPEGTYTLVAKDPLKLADGDRAQAPALSGGRLLAAIDDDDTSITLLPAGIGDEEYPEITTAGPAVYLNIGGNEIVLVTDRDGDDLTITRGQLGTVASAHEDGDRAQIVLSYVGEDPAVIIDDLLDRAGVPDAYRPLAAWQAETAAFLDRVYTGRIAEPTSVSQLISELAEQSGLALWWDDINALIRLQVLRPIATTARILNVHTIEPDSLRISEQPDKGITQVWVYFGQIDPTKPLDDPSNYRSTEVTIDSDAEANNGSPVVKKIFSRWIAAGGRSVASRVGSILLNRLGPLGPRKVSWSEFRTYDESEPVLGGGCRMEAECIQDATGAPADIPLQVIRLAAGKESIAIEAEENSAVPLPDITVHTIILDANENNVDLRERHDEIWGEAQDGDQIEFSIEAGVIIGSTAAAQPALDIGTWPSGVAIGGTIRGAVRAAGGDAGNGGYSSGSITTWHGQPGEAGGTAIYTRQALDLEIETGGEVSGGGGGAGGGASNGAYANGGGGGGGAGNLPGSGGAATPDGVAGQPGGQTSGGSGGAGGFFGGPSGGGGAGGTGGSLGNAGSAGANSSNASGGAAGAAGKAIDGDSYISLTNNGTINGPQVN